MCKIDVAALKRTRAYFQLCLLLPGEYPEEAVACSAAALNGLLYMVLTIDDPGKSRYTMSAPTYTRYHRQEDRVLSHHYTLLSQT